MTVFHYRALLNWCFYGWQRDLRAGGTRDEDARRGMRSREPFAEDQFCRLVDRDKTEEGQHPEHGQQAHGDVEHDPALEAKGGERTAKDRAAQRSATLSIISSYRPPGAVPGGDRRP